MSSTAISYISGFSVPMKWDKERQLRYVTSWQNQHANEHQDIFNRLQSLQKVVSGNIQASTLDIGGSGYALNDTFQVDAGYIPAQGEVLSVSNTGVVLSYELTFSGAGYQLSSNVPTTATTGSGGGLILNVTAVSGTQVVEIDTSSAYFSFDPENMKDLNMFLYSNNFQHQQFFAWINQVGAYLPNLNQPPIVVYALLNPTIKAVGASVEFYNRFMQMEHDTHVMTLAALDSLYSALGV